MTNKVVMKINGKEVDDLEFSYSTVDGEYIDAFGNTAYRVNGVPHRKDGPALVYNNGQLEYWQNGVRHREPKEGPAVVFPNGNGDYWVYGRRLKDFCQRLLGSRWFRWVYYKWYHNTEKQFDIRKLPKHTDIEII
jgi:hypothetical protein